MLTLNHKRRAPLPLPSNQACRKLAGTPWQINSDHYVFCPMQDPGMPSWRRGGEGIAFPLVESGTDHIIAWLKMFRTSVDERRERTEWMIKENIHSQSEYLSGAPREWIDTRVVGRPVGIDFDICGSLSVNIPGCPWEEWKNRMVEDKQRIHDSFRLRAAIDLLKTTSILEKKSICHGDLSPGNIILDLMANRKSPVLRLCDFDAIVVRTSRNSVKLGLSTDKGGTCGTPGYSPPELQDRCSAGESVLPESDRFGRDILLPELLGFTHSQAPDISPMYWDTTHLNRLWRSCQARLSRCDYAIAGTLRSYLRQPNLFDLKESERLSSKDLLA